MNDYLTLLRESSDEIVIQKSRFIGYAAPCSTEEEALDFLKKIRSGHRDARHHCYAYVIGSNSGVMRYSDDGEPGGTAGMPMMDVIRGRRVVNCCVVVVRYFGGILLGTGGLVRAYTQACKLALEASGIARMEWTFREYCDLPYPCWDTVRHALEKLPARIENVSFGASVTFDLLVREKDLSSVLEALQKSTGRQMESISAGEGFECWPETPGPDDCSAL